MRSLHRYRTNLELTKPGSTKPRQKITLLTEMPINELSDLITGCFAFFEALFHSYTYSRKQLARIRKYHKLPQHEVLELLSKDNLLYGFNMHFSNGSKATFKREPESVEALNILFQSDGSVNFMIGNLDKLSNN